MSDNVWPMAGLTDTGRVREANEDAIAWDESVGLAVLADGMGGHNAGDVASRLAVDELMAILQPALGRPLRLRPNKGVSRHATLVRRALNKANTRVYEAAHGKAAYSDMGTTVVVAVLYDDRIVVAHVGDSRAYRLRGGELEQLTTDHSLAEELIRNGALTAEDARGSPYAHVIHRAIGVERRVTADISEYDTQPGDLYLLCSDGLSDLVDDETVHAVLAECGEHPDETTAQALVDAANEHGGDDNISVVLIGVEEADEAKRGK